MKKWNRILLILAAVIALWIPFELGKETWSSDFGDPWVVDIDASLARINEIPGAYDGKFTSLEEYKEFVRKKADGLTFVIHENGTASMSEGWFGSSEQVWREDDDFDYWIYTRTYMSAGVGHGFTRVSARTAQLKYQLEWSENVATREHLVLQRQ